MPVATRYFTVTAPQGMSDIKLDSRGCATCQITAKNVSRAAIDGRAILVSLPFTSPPAGVVEKNWVKIDGPTERHFAIDQEEVFSLRIAVPQKKGEPAPAGNFSFRLDVVNVARPDDSGDQSQALRFTVAAAAPTKRSMWPLIAAAAAVVLVGAGLATWLLTRGNPVPDLNGKTTADAVKILASAKFILDDENIGHVDSVPENSGLIVAQNPQAGKRASPGSLVKITLGTLMGPESVQCSVFDDDYNNLFGPSDVVFVNGTLSSDGSLNSCVNGACRKWFGRCATTISHSPVFFYAFDDGISHLSGRGDAVYVTNNLKACISNNTKGVTCRKWFGRGVTRDGRPVVCDVHNDGGGDRLGPIDAMFPQTVAGWPHQLCLNNGTAQGECRKWLGSCRVQ